MIATTKYTPSNLRPYKCSNYKRVRYVLYYCISVWLFFLQTGGAHLAGPRAVALAAPEKSHEMFTVPCPSTMKSSYYPSASAKSTRSRWN